METGRGRGQLFYIWLLWTGEGAAEKEEPIASMLSRRSGVDPLEGEDRGRVNGDAEEKERVGKTT